MNNQFPSNVTEVPSRANQFLTLYVQRQNGCWQQLHTVKLDHPHFDEYRQPLCFALDLEQSPQSVLLQESAESCGVIPPGRLEIQLKLKGTDDTFRPVAFVSLNELPLQEDYESPYQLRLIIAGQDDQAYEVELPCSCAIPHKSL